jgi:hypothetical protein
VNVPVLTSGQRITGAVLGLFSAASIYTAGWPMLGVLAAPLIFWGVWVWADYTFRCDEAKDAADPSGNHGGRRRPVVRMWIASDGRKESWFGRHGTELLIAAWVAPIVVALVVLALR